MIGAYILMVVARHAEIRWLLMVLLVGWNLLLVNRHHHVGGDLGVDGLEMVPTKAESRVHVGLVSHSGPISKVILET